MSVYLDVKTGKMFNTLPELKAFQAGASAPASKPKEVKVEVKQDRKQEVEEPKKRGRKGKEEEVYKEPLSRDYMIQALIKDGIDPLVLKDDLDDSAIAELYKDIIG